MLIVKKYGGSSVSTPLKILKIAQSLKEHSDQGHQLIVIVSAMGDSTDELVELSRQITHTPIQREMDMLLSAGERISMALMAIALNSLNCDAISFTGSQSGVMTDGSHSNARITAIKAFRVEEELRKGRVVIIAGFQGVNPLTKEITTLGRGGSDTTAVALAAHFKADRCEILTDVEGLFTVDPRLLGTGPQPIPRLDFDSTLEMAYWGARVLHYRAVELAERTGVPLLVALSSGNSDKGTMIKHKDAPMETTEILTVNYNSEVAAFKFPPSLDLKSCLHSLELALNASNSGIPKIIYERQGQQGREIFISAPPEMFEGIQDSLKIWSQKHGKPVPEINTSLATVTLTGRGLIHSPLLFEASRHLSENEIETEALITTSLSVTFVVSHKQVQKAAQLLHQKFVELKN